MTEVSFEQLQAQTKRQCKHILLYWSGLAVFTLVMALLGQAGGEGVLTAWVDFFVFIFVFIAYSISALPMAFSKSLEVRNLGFMLVGTLLLFPVAMILLVGATGLFSHPSP
jgi:hypothetical protein